MNELHKSQEELQQLVPIEGKQGLLLHSVRIFEEANITSLKELGNVLGRIHKRVTSEGYVMSDGRFIKSDKSV